MSNVDNVATNIYGLIASTVGLIAAVPLIWVCIRSQLPMTKLRELDEALTDTESLLRSVVEEGLLDLTHDVPHFQGFIDQFRSSAERLREETYMATDFKQQIASWFDGLSKKISMLSAEVITLRANICETSVEARKQLMLQPPCAPITRPGKWAQFCAALGRCLCCIRTKSKTAGTVSERIGAQPSCTAPSCDPTSLPEIHSGPNSVECDDVNTKPAQQTCTPRTIYPRDRKSRMRALARAIRRIDKDLESQGVVHPVLKKMVRATNQRRSSVSSKPSHTHRSRRAYSLLFYPSTVEQTVVLPQACDSSDDSDEDSWEEATACDENEFAS